MNQFDRLIKFLQRLQASKIHYSLGSIRTDSVLVLVSVPGERWEVEFMADGSIEIETFKSNGSILGESQLEELFRKFSD